MDISWLHGWTIWHFVCAWNALRANAFLLHPPYTFIQKPSSTRVMDTHRIFREMGGLEHVLNRRNPLDTPLNPDEPSVSLQTIPHAFVAYFNGRVGQTALTKAVEAAIRRHPILRAGVELTSPTSSAWVELLEAPTILAQNVIRVVNVCDSELHQAAFGEFESQLDSTSFDLLKPQWGIKYFVGDTTSALVVVFNHAADDQIALNELVFEIMSDATYNDSDSVIPSLDVDTFDFPPSMEQTVANGPPTLKTVWYALYELVNILQRPEVLPQYVHASAEAKDPRKRRTICIPQTLTNDTITVLRQIAHSYGCTVTSALAAAVLFATSDFMHATSQRNGKGADHTYRFLQSVNLRPFEQVSGSDPTARTVVCAGGALDFNVAVEERSGERFVENVIGKREFWALAQKCHRKATEFIKSGLVPETVRLFDAGCKVMDMVKAVQLEESNSQSCGRAYTCGVSNVGVYNHPTTFRSGSTQVELTEAYFGTSHSRSGTLFQMSCMTIGTNLHVCFQFPVPVVSFETAVAYSERVLQILRIAIKFGVDV